MRLFIVTHRPRTVTDMRRMHGPPCDRAWDEAIQAYAEFSFDSLRCQHFFENHGRYKHQRFADVQSAYLGNEMHMLTNYLPGMVLSHYLWFHHYAMGQTYRQKFTPRVQAAIRPTSFVEIGTGSAMYTIHTLRAFPEIRGTGYDISPHSVRFGRELITRLGLADRVEIVQVDGFVRRSDPPADFVLSQEVLEHLEDPQTFCSNLFRLLRSGGMGFISAAITAAHSDHIYLFRSPEEVETMLRKAGFTILDSTVEVAYAGKPIEITPRVAGYLVGKD